MKKIFTFGFLLFALSNIGFARSHSTLAKAKVAINADDIPGSYYDWGTAQNGYGYCYEWTYNHQVLNGGNPVADFLCESNRPSFYNWGRAHNGYGYCYHYTPYGKVMNAGSPVAEFQCEAVAPSYYDWGRAHNGYTYCYHYSSNGLTLNEGNPVADFLCR